MARNKLTLDKDTLKLFTQAGYEGSKRLKEKYGPNAHSIIANKRWNKKRKKVKVMHS